MKNFLFGATAALLASGMLVPNIAAAAADKANVCHVTGNGGVKLLSVSVDAVRAHLAHGDFLPGETIPAGDSSPGQFGSTVTPVTIIGNDCSRIDALKVVSPPMSFNSACGWAGWSCIEDGYPKIIGGGHLPADASVCAEGPAKAGVTVGSSTYPNYPHYNFTPPEEGWVVSANTGVTNIVAICGK